MLGAYLLVRTGTSDAVAGGSNGSGERQAAIFSRVEFGETLTTQIASAADFDLDFADPAADGTFTDPGVYADAFALESGRVGDLGGASNNGDGELGGGAASFFGVAARGTRFAYIVDVSGSMDESRMSKLIRALSGSLQQLLAEARFVVAMYNSETEFAGKDRWTRPTRPTITRTLGAMNTYARGGTGGTVPLSAFEEIFKLRPKPDAIYFMTDGDFGNPQRARLIAAEIHRLNLLAGRLSAIHCITFIDDGSADVMRTIAAQSRGTYTHIFQDGTSEDRTPSLPSDEGGGQ